MIDGEARRICSSCGTGELIGQGEAMFPPGWRCRACGHGPPQEAGIPLFAPELADTVSGFDPGSFALIAEIEASHFWFVERRELIVWLANRHFPRARSLLEIGCGNGAVLNALRESRHWERVAGSDLHPTGLAQARGRMPAGVELIQMDARAIPVRATFDLVGAFDVIEHIEEDEQALRSIHAALKAGGGAIITVPQHPWLWSAADEMAHHKRRYRRGELEAKLRRNGFEIVASFSYGASLLPLLIANRLLARSATGQKEVEREVLPSPRLNTALQAVLRAEVGLTRAGVSWPVGGSRVAVVRAV